MARKIQIGDIIEITTKGGLAYAQLTHNHPRYSSLIRILPGYFETTPDDLSHLVREPSVFVTFFPLQGALNRGIFKIVGNHPVPRSAMEFPVFRTGVINPATGKVDVWWLWDGKEERMVGTISTEQRQLPIRGICNDTLLIERIENGWTPMNDES